MPCPLSQNKLSTQGKTRPEQRVKLKIVSKTLRHLVPSAFLSSPCTSLPFPVALPLPPSVSSGERP